MFDEGKDDGGSDNEEDDATAVPAAYDDYNGILINFNIIIIIYIYV
jgi:hypothetical protein